MTNDDIVERVARAICRAYFPSDLNTPDGMAHWKSNQDRCRKEARAAIAAMREPTAANLSSFTARMMSNLDGEKDARIERLRTALKDIQAKAVGVKPPRHTWYYDRAEEALKEAADDR